MAKTKAPRFFKFTGLDGKEYSLTLQQKLFVEEYLEWKGDGVEAIIEAGYNVNYKNKKGEDTGVPNRKLAAVIASQNLIKLNICAYVTLKLDEYGFNDDNIAKQHLFLINQFADLNAKKGGIDMFYKRFGKYAAKKFKFVDENEDLTDEQIKEELALLREKRRKSGKKSDNKGKEEST